MQKPTYMAAFAHVGAKLLVVDAVFEEVIGWLDRLVATSIPRVKIICAYLGEPIPAIQAN